MKNKNRPGRIAFQIFTGLLLGVAFFAFAHAASASTYYVATDGNDGDTGGVSDPWATLQHAADNVSAGDTVIVADGTYADSATQGDGYDYALYISTSGSSGSPITFEAQNVGGAVIDDSGFSEYGIGFDAGVHHIVIQGFEIKNFTYSGIHGDDYSSPGDEIHDITISQNHIDHIANDDLNPDTDSRTGVTAPAHSYSFTIDSNTFNNIGRTDVEGSHIDHAIYLFGHDQIITNNLFYNDSAGWMIDISDEGDTSGSQNIQVSNNTFSGAACGDGESGQIIVESNQGSDQITNVVISNNISFGSIDALVYWQSNTNTITSAYIRNNTSIDSAIDIHYPGSGITRANNNLGVNTEVIFTDYSSNDYTLLSGSPAIDHSYATDAPDHDILQVSRPIGSESDDGCYEFDSSESDAPTFTVNEGTDTGPVKTDTINVTVNDASSISASEYGYSSDATCDVSDTYGNSFTTDVNFDITGDHTNYLCVMATDEYSNTGYQLVGQLNTDNTAPTITVVEGTDAGPTKTDTINLTISDASSITASEYGYSSDSTCDVSDTYGNSFSTGVNFDITGNHTEYLCSKATDAATNTGYQLVGQLNTDNTAPTLSFTDDVAAGPVVSDTVTGDWGDASVKKWDYDADGVCSTTSGDYTKTDANSMDQADETNNGLYICMYGEDTAGNYSTLASANDINVDTGAESDAPTFTVNEGTDTGPVKTDTINVTVNDASSISASEYGYSSDATCDVSDTYGNSFTTDVNFDITGDHTNYLCVMATDEYSNTGYQLVGQLNTDNTAPTLSFTDDVAAGPATSDTVTGDWGDASVKKWDYDADGTCSTTSGDYSKTDSDSMSQTDETNDTKYICLYGEDAAGNYDTLASANDINIDVSAPTGGSFTINGGDSSTDSTSVTLNVTCPTDSWATIQMAYGNTASPTNWKTCASSQSHTLTSGDGTKTVYMRFRDGGQNTTSDTTDTITLDTSSVDTTAPISTADPEGGTYSSAQSVTLTCEDEAGGSGCDAIYYTVDGITPTTSSTQYSSPITISETTTLKFFATDLSGNPESVNTEEYVIDENAEEYDISRPEIKLSDGSKKLKPKKTYWSDSKTARFEGETEGLEGGFVKIYNGKKKLGEADIDNSGCWSKKIHFGHNKLYKIRFKYYTSADEQVDKSSEYRIRIDTTGPRFTDLPDKLIKRRGNKVWWDAEDNGEIDHYAYYLDGKKKKTSHKYFYLPTNLRRGYHTLRIKAYDEAGNKRSKKVQLYIR